jgi:DNA replication protein DnaC
MREAIIEKLTGLQLHGFISALREQSEVPIHQDLPFEDRLALLVEQEYLRRNNLKIGRMLKSAQLRQSATIEQIEFKPSRGLNKSYILDLAGGNWVREHHNLIVTGATGVGKSFIACALGERLCRSGFTVRYVKTAAFIQELMVARQDGSFKRLNAATKGVDVLILDEWMRDLLPVAETREIFDLLDDRFRIASCIFVAQIPVADWYKNIADPTLAEAILDRVVYDSLRLEITGESMRKDTSTVAIRPLGVDSGRQETVAALR